MAGDTALFDELLGQRISRLRVILAEGNRQYPERYEGFQRGAAQRSELEHLEHAVAARNEQKRAGTLKGGVQ